MATKSKSKRPKRGADGLYHVQAYIGRYQDGRKFYKRFIGSDWKQLQFDILTFRKEYESGQHQEEDPTVEKVLTLDEAFIKYIDTCRALCQSEGDYSHSTIPGYESIRKHAFQSIMSKPIDKITIDDIQSYLDTATNAKTGKRKSGKTLRNEFYLLKPVLEKYAPHMDLNKIKLAKRKKRRKMVMRMADAPTILAAAYDRHPEFFLYTLFTMVLGLRPSEVYALTWGDISAQPQISLVDQQKRLYGTVSVNKAAVMNEDRVYKEKGPKTEAGARTLVHDWSFFETLYAARPRGADHERMLEMTPRRQQYHWNLLRDDLGLAKEMRFYDLRHYHCSVMVASGAPEDYIAADMGHSTIQMAHDVYVELLEEKQQDINLSVANYTADLMQEFCSKLKTTETTKRTTETAKMLDIAR